MNTTAQALNARGMDLEEQGRLDESEKAYLAAIEHAPDWGVPWYNLGLIAKKQRRWTDSARYNERAIELDSTNTDAYWNLGIAATALSNWILARRAWRGCGLEMPEGDGEFWVNYGPVPIRLNPEDEGEVVWCDRIDPARAIIRNIPLPGSAYHAGDIVLHDGVPNGARMWGGREFKVFDAIQVLVRSGRETFEAVVEVATPQELEALQQMGTRADVWVEDWESITWICKQCSEGVAHSEHTPVPGPWKAQRCVALAAHARETASRLLHEWAAQALGGTVVSFPPVSRQ